MCFAVITGLCPYEANFAYVATFKLVYRHFWLRSSSVASVLAIWQRWKAWARLKLSVPVLPAIPLQVALYLTGLVDRTIWQGYSVSVMSLLPTVSTGDISVSWFWASERTSTGARRKLARPAFQSKQPLSHDVITDITLILNTTSQCFLGGHSFFVYPFGWIC